MRATLQQIARLVKSDAAFALHAIRSGKNDIAFRATVSGKDDQGGALEYDVAADDGKMRAFKDADDFVKACGPIGLMSGDTVTMEIDNLALVHAKPFTGDILKKNASAVASYGKRVTTAQAKSTKLADEITLLQADPAVPASYVQEKTDQKAAVDDNITFLQAEITRLGGT